MKANELRIGNLLRYSDDSSIWNVSGIHEFGIDCFNEIENTYIEYECFEPIKLTEEFLNKLGFEWSVKHQAFFKNDFEYVIDFYKTYPNTNGCLAFINKHHRSGEKLIIIKYVHQLQNLFFTLTGKELEIKQQ